MKCPYCGSDIAKRKKDVSFRSYSCPRCDYLFEVSAGRIFLDIALSVPFSSLIYTPILMVAIYFLSKTIFNAESSLFSFGAFFMFMLIATALVLLFVFYLNSGRSSRIFIVKSQENKSVISFFKNIHPLIKISVFLIIASIFAAIFF